MSCETIGYVCFFNDVVGVDFVKVAEELYAILDSRCTEQVDAVVVNAVVQQLREAVSRPTDVPAAYDIRHLSYAPSHWKLISKLVSKFVYNLVDLFREKIYSVNSQLSEEINFEILFRNLERILFCEILLQNFHLWSALIGQSASVYKYRMKRRRCSLHMAFESLLPI